MTITLEQPALTALTDDELAAMYGPDDTLNVAILAEGQRRDDAGKRRQARRQDPVACGWEEAARAQYTQAERECRGKLIGPNAPDTWLADELSLWRYGNDKYATEELRNWWQLPGNARMTITEYQRQLAASQEAYAHELDRDASDAVRPDASAGQEGPGGSADSGRDSVPGHDAGPEASSSSTADRPDGHRGHARADQPRNDRRVAMTATLQMPDVSALTDAELDGIYGPNAELDTAIDAERLRRNGTVTGLRAPAEVAVCEPAPAVATMRRPDVDGAETLQYIREFLRHFAVWPSEASLTAATLWVAQAHARGEDGMPVWAYAPRFMLLSKGGGSGKSWMARLMAKLSPEGRMLVEMTPAALVQKIAEHRTIVVDETDILFGQGGRNSKIRALVNAGYEPDQTTSRMRGREAQEIPLMGPMILAGLDKLKNATGEDLKTLVSRCIIVHVRKAPDGYRPPRFDGEARAVAELISQRAARWLAQEVLNGIGDVVPDVPEGLGNRPAALWEPLFAVADAAGSDWPAAARDACVQLESANGVPDQQEEDDRSLDSFFAGISAAGGELP